ncbi:MAG: DUF4924 family protein [Tannerella sp.]|jgi:copper chaperone CopZ|nr:DUF4924 family protein [Tannerella sp.]
MITARQTKKENIVEYLLYMWQVEDLIRACHFSMDEIESRIISQYEQPEEIKREIRQWYQELIDMMRIEGVKETGHIRINKNVMAELTDLHLRLLKSPQEAAVYGALYQKTLPAIVQLRSKSGGKEVSEIETCLTAVYGYVLLKMQRTEISAETGEAIRQISNLLAFLAAGFREERNGTCLN